MRYTRAHGALLALALASLAAGCAWKPTVYDAEEQAAVSKAEAAFREDARLQPFFDEAAGYVVLPLSIRAGSGFGGAWGSGWLLEDGAAVGKVRLLEFQAGAHVGAQGYRSIIFFRTPEKLEQFKGGRMEFVGQANAAATVVGATFTPAWSTDVAVFTQVRAGLLVEASVGAQHYDFYPLDALAAR
jgi:lipid-binding SYLF domain-containing protein